ncbi:deoxyribonuclease IV [Selenomonas sp. WCA-380-WT-3B 3/]|uniref:Probable endonuclease 4 n=1 Tax=Selenomonas montiformis TaxID=2652285 RepID=A0A6I2UZI5_9FIRM|nr:deoxyribonuclease IV [Selenomonas montiformis]MSV25500.1 deoxyribonuclease IV [Selenomonas montiformis]
MKQLHIGSHLSSAGGYLTMGREAAELGADTFAFFTRNPRGGRAKALDEEDVAAFCTFAAAHHFVQVVAHAPYTMNACAAREELREFARDVLREDLRRMEYMPGNYYNFHPGSHVKQGAAAGIEKIAGLLNEVLTPQQSTTVLLETMAGKGTEVGRSFEELRAILDRIERKEKVGVCLDTCHVWDAGYDIAGDLDGVLREFDRIVGLPRLRAVHLNDSLNACGSRKDRHARIGEGKIGLAALAAVTNHPRLRNLPFILETPNDHAGYAREIALMRSCWKEERM